MHELSVAMSILTIAEEHLPAGVHARVKTVRIKVGELAGVVVDSLEFCFSAVTPGTPLEGAQLDIERVAASARCLSCGTVAPIDSLSYLCPACGAAGLTLLAGNELQVTELELDDELKEPSP